MSEISAVIVTTRLRSLLWSICILALHMLLSDLILSPLIPINTPISLLDNKIRTLSKGMANRKISSKRNLILKSQMKIKNSACKLIKFCTIYCYKINISVTMHTICDLSLGDHLGNRQTLICRKRCTRGQTLSYPTCIPSS